MSAAVSNVVASPSQHEPSTLSTATLDRVNEDIWREVLEKLLDCTHFGDRTPAITALTIFATSDGLRTLQQSVPLVSRAFYYRSRAVRMEHVRIRNSRQLNSFSSALAANMVGRTTTELNVMCESRDSLALLPAVLNALPALQRLALYHRFQSHGSDNAPGRMEATLVHAITQLNDLKVLILPGEDSIVQRQSVVLLGEELRNLEFLHLPPKLAAPGPSGDALANAPLEFPRLRTLSTAQYYVDEDCASLHQVLSVCNFPLLWRLNVLGNVSDDLTEFDDTLGCVRILETLSSNIKIWEALACFHERDSSMPLVESLILHLERYSGWLGSGLPNIRAIVIHASEPEPDRCAERIDVLLDAVARFKEGSPLLASVHVVMHTIYKVWEPLMSIYDGDFARRGMRFTWLFLEDLTLE